VSWAGVLSCALLAWAPGLASGAEAVTIDASGRAAWSDLVEAQAAQGADLASEAPVDVPFMPVPEGRDIGEAGPLAPAAGAPEPGGEPDAQGPTVTVSFQALPDNNTSIPPDTHGAAGPSHLMTMINTQVLIQNKAGGTVSGPVSLTTFWTGGTGLSGSPFDPRVVYDSIHGRWIATCDANGQSATSKVFFAISDTSDPTGFWTFYSFTADATGTTWADFPGFGVNTTWIAITNNMFTVAANAFVGVKMWVIDKSTALVPGGPITVSVFGTGFDNGGGFTGSTLQPCITFGASATLYIIDNGGWSSGGIPLLRCSQITGTGAAPAWSVCPGSSVVAGSGFFFVVNDFEYGLVGAPQLGTAGLISTNDTRLSGLAVYRNGRIWCAHSGGRPAGGPVNRTAAYWYQINPTGLPAPIVQSGFLDGGAGVHHIFASIAANKNNDACMGFSRAHAGIFCEAVYTGRSGTDALNTMDPVSVLKAGEDSYVKTFSGASIRWGDYSATVVDPTDDESLWTIQEYAALDVGPGPSDDRWGTWWGGKIVATATCSIDSWASVQTHGTVGEQAIPLVEGVNTSDPRLVGANTLIRVELTSNVLPVVTGTVQAVDQNTAATFDGTTGVTDNGGGSYTLDITFAPALPSAPINASPATAAGCYVIDLASNLSCLTGDTDMRFTIVQGDASGDRKTLLNDFAIVKIRASTPPAAITSGLLSDIRADMSKDGSILLNDVAIVKLANGRQVTCP
jgi:hypothetical protein